jgi:hypothetical protein
MLKPQHIQLDGGLARRLLRRAPGIVYNSTLYGFVIWCIGCVIPTPLDRAPADTNYAPSFVTARVNPLFGKTPVPTGGINLTLYATDPNHDDVLTVHLFEQIATGALIPTSAPATLMIPVPADPDDPNLRIGSIDATPCVNAPDGTSFLLYAVVADRPFTGNTPRADGGLTDSNHWEVTCTSM